MTVFRDAWIGHRLFLFEWGFGWVGVESDYLGESERFGVVFPVSSHCLGLEEPLSAVLSGLNGILSSWLGWLVWLVFLVVLRL
ncbi:hypothetical protein CXB77_05400 (plasmid) [Chromatium okenii]|uniref:Uncharacterized protein n=1 Tax=Chromatium okenii TaxID=61644 RepID=A0A2S7XTU5_9GAMM|nr:hypothetical protein CXB77_05400 [Chromatium okenii]